MSLFIKFGIYAQILGVPRLFTVNDEQQFKEHNLDDLTIQTTHSLSFFTRRSCGGIKGRMYTNNNSTDEVVEINPDTGARIQGQTYTQNQIRDVGGTKNYLFCGTDGAEGDIYLRLNPSTLTRIGSFSPEGDRAFGIGGTEDDDFIYGVDSSRDNLRRFNRSTGAQLNNVSFPDAESCGSVNDRGIFTAKVEIVTTRVNEFDRTTLSSINSWSSSIVGDDTNGIGGMKV